MCRTAFTAQPTLTAQQSQHVHHPSSLPSAILQFSVFSSCDGLGHLQFLALCSCPVHDLLVCSSCLVDVESM
eukprot:7535746-Lingulodinium_polyedra.AAC.1